MKLDIEEWKIVYRDVLAQSQYFMQNCTPIDEEAGILDAIIAPRQKILDKVKKVIEASNGKDKTPDI